MIKIIKFLGWFCIFVQILFIFGPAFSKQKKDCKSNGLPEMIALELLQSKDDAQKINECLGAAGRDDMKKNLDIDSYGFVPFYLILGLFLCYLLFSRDGNPWKALAVAGAILLIITAFCDVFGENPYLKEVLDGNYERLDALHFWSIAKWAAGFVFIAVISTLFWRGRHIMSGTFALALLAAATGLYGIFFNHIFISVAFGLTVLCFFAIGICFAGDADYFWKDKK
jgi:FtsH-binding integral membrane protein